MSQSHLEDTAGRHATLLFCAVVVCLVVCLLVSTAHASSVHEGFEEGPVGVLHCKMHTLELVAIAHYLLGGIHFYGGSNAYAMGLPFALLPKLAATHIIGLLECCSRCQLRLLQETA
jgi:hypothetical protein